jgi:S-adenosyl-L-methionine hydrolase (adenosine-forming)
LAEVPAPIALLTDFGARDAYAGVMKGVLLTRCPGAVLVDLAHEVPPRDVLTGALLLASAVPFFPTFTVFLAVVDPGVGSARRPLCIRSGHSLLVGPDNGLLWPAASRCGLPQVFHLDRPEYWLPECSATFHGRDVFAPVAALLASGRQPEELGTPVHDPVQLEIPSCTFLAGAAHGEVLLVDRFGNAVTNIRPSDVGHPASGSARLEVGGRAVLGPSSHYSAVPRGEFLFLPGSLGYYEIALNGGDAAASLDLQPGSRILLRVRK